MYWFHATANTTHLLMKILGVVGIYWHVDMSLACWSEGLLAGLEVAC